MIANQSDRKVKVAWSSIMTTPIRLESVPRFARKIDYYVTDATVPMETIRDYLTALIGDHPSVDQTEFYIHGVFASLAKVIGSMGEQVDRVIDRVATVIDVLIDTIEQGTQRFRGLVMAIECLLEYNFSAINVHPERLFATLVLGEESLSYYALVKSHRCYRMRLAELTKHSAIRLIMVPGRDGGMTDQFAMIASRQRLFGKGEVCIRGIYLMPCQYHQDPRFRQYRDQTGGTRFGWYHTGCNILMSPDYGAEFVTIECGTDLTDTVSVQLPTAIQGALDQIGVFPRAKSARSAI